MPALSRRILDFFLPGPPRPRVEDERAIARRYRFWRWSAFLSITIGYGFFYTTRLSFSVAKKPLIESGLLDAKRLGRIGFSSKIAYAFGKLVNGFLADRLNPSRFFATGLLLSALANVFFGLTSAYPVFVLLWAVNGWLQSLGSPTSGVVMAQWFSHGERGTRYSIWSTSHNIGEAITFVFTSLLVHTLGWRWGFFGPGLVCIGVALLLYWTLTDHPRTQGLPPVEEFRRDRPPARGEETLSQREVQLEVLRNVRVWVLALSSGLMYVARYGINDWGVFYLQIEKSYSLPEAGLIVSLFHIVGFFGSGFSGYLSDRFFGARRAPLTLAYGILAFVALAVLYLCPPGHPWIIRLAMGAAGLAIGGLLVFLGGLAAIDICSKRASGAAMGLVGFVSYLGAASQDWISGSLIEGSRRIVDGVTVYDFSTVKYVWIGAALLSLLLALTLWSSEPRATPTRPSDADPP